MKCISKALVGGFYALFLFVPAASDARGLPSRASVDIEAEMAFDALLSRVAQKTLDQYRMKAGSQAPDQAVARFDVSTGSVTVELRGWLPETGGAELEDLQGQLMNEVLDQARLIYPASGIEFRYNGRSFEEHYPEEAAADGVRSPLRWTSPVRARSSVARAPSLQASRRGPVTGEYGTAPSHFGKCSSPCRAYTNSPCELSFR